MKTANENDASPTDIDRDAPAIIRLERVIPAHRQRIWDLHADVAGWPKWQLDIATASIDGPLAAGSALTWTTAGLDKPIVSTIHAVEPHRSTLWSGPASGIVGIHRWAFDDTDAGTRVTTEESWGGGRARRGKSNEGSQDARNVTRTLARLPRHGGDILKAKWLGSRCGSLSSPAMLPLPCPQCA
jgi:hypothetical protein